MIILMDQNTSNLLTGIAVSIFTLCGIVLGALIGGGFFRRK